MDVPSNAMWFSWQGNASNEIGYDMVITSVPNVILPSTRCNTYTVDYRDGAIVQPIGLDMITISFDVAYIGSLNERQFTQAMVEFFYKVNRYQAETYDKSKDFKNKLFFSKDLDDRFLEDGEFVWYEAQMISQIDFQKFYQYKTATLTFLCQPTIHVGNAYDGVLTFEKSASISQVQANTIYNISVYSRHITRNDRSPKMLVGVNLMDWSTLNTVAKFIIFLKLPYDTAQMENGKKYCYARRYVFDWSRLKNLFYVSGSELVLQGSIYIDTDNDVYNLYTYAVSGGEEIKKTYDISSYLITTDSSSPDMYTMIDDFNFEEEKTQGPTNLAIKLQGAQSWSVPDYSKSDKIAIYLKNSGGQSVSSSNVASVRYYTGDKIL